jgi:hypothetical protein
MARGESPNWAVQDDEAPLVSELVGLVRLAAGLRRFARDPLTPAEARRLVAERMRTRSARFLEIFHRAAWSRRESPYRQPRTTLAWNTAMSDRWSRRTAWRARWTPRESRSQCLTASRTRSASLRASASTLSSFNVSTRWSRINILPLTITVSTSSPCVT